MKIKDLEFVIFPCHEDAFIAWKHTFVMTGRKIVYNEGSKQSVVVARMDMTREIFEDTKDVYKTKPCIRVAYMTNPKYKGRGQTLSMSAPIFDYTELLNFVAMNTDLEIEGVKR